MPRGPLTQETKLKRAQEVAAATAKALGLTDFTFEVPAETYEDKVLAANAVLEYFYRGGEGFRDRECKNCGLVFAYSWSYSSIVYCSVDCMKKAFEKIGIEWDASRSLGDRYREMNYESRPAVVPPEALAALDALLERQRNGKSLEQQDGQIQE